MQNDQRGLWPNCQCLEKVINLNCQGSCANYYNTFTVWCHYRSYHFEMWFCRPTAMLTKCVSHVKITLSFWHTDCLGGWVCVHSTPQEKNGISENEAEIGSLAGPGIQLAVICFARNQVLSDADRSQGFLGEEGGKGILAFCTRSVLTPFSIIVMGVFSLTVLFYLEFANHIVHWGTELLEIGRHVKGRKPLLCHLASSLALAILTST